MSVVRRHPAIAEGHTAATRLAHTTLNSAGDARILVVDDDEAIRRVIAAILTSAGYRVSVASDGRDALRQLTTATDLLITDLVMPELDGLELIRDARGCCPALRVIAMSGAFGGQFLQVAELLGADASLNKPIWAEGLLTTVRCVLDEAVRPVREGAEAGEATR